MPGPSLRPRMSLPVPAAALASFYFSYFAFIGVFATYFSLYLQHLGRTPAEIGILMSMLNAVRIVTPTAWAWLSDHSGQRMTLIRQTFAAAIAVFCLLFFIDSFWALFAVVVIMCTFWSATMPIFEATVMSHLAGDTGRYGRIRLWGSVGFIIAVTGAGMWLDRVSITQLIPLVLVLMVITLACAWRVPEKRGVGHNHPPLPVWQVVRDPDVILFFVACCLMLASQGASYVFYSLFMVEQGFSKTTVGLLWSVGVVAEILVFLFLPRIFSRVSLYQLWMLSFGLTVIRYLIVAWLPHLLAAQVLAQALHMFTFGTFHATAMAVVHARFRGRLQARGQALYSSLAFGLGGALGGLVSGWTWSVWGAAWTFTLSSAMAGAGLLLLVLRPGMLVRPE